MLALAVLALAVLSAPARSVADGPLVSVPVSAHGWQRAALSSHAAERDRTARLSRRLRGAAHRCHVQAAAVSAPPPLATADPRAGTAADAGSRHRRLRWFVQRIKSEHRRTRLALRALTLAPNRAELDSAALSVTRRSPDPPPRSSTSVRRRPPATRPRWRSASPAMACPSTPPEGCTPCLESASSGSDVTTCLTRYAG